jgi:hypothetical protein
MTVCQGCGRGCNSDLCCPTCASMDRSSFFCSQDCFRTNWKEHCKLHAIIQQQIRMAELDNQERKMKGLNAASSAFSAISELFRAPTPDKVAVQPSKEEDSVNSFKDHQVRPLDRVIGPNGLLRGFRILLVLTAFIFLVFFKINSMISEIPVVVEKRAVVKVSNAVDAGAVLVSPSRAPSLQNSHAGVGADVVKSVVNAPVDEANKALKDEVERLRKQVEKYKGLYEASANRGEVDAKAEDSVTEASTSVLDGNPEEASAERASEEPQLETITEGVGVVREEDPVLPRMLREVGAVGVRS